MGRTSARFTSAGARGISNPTRKSFPGRHFIRKETMNTALMVVLGLSALLDLALGTWASVAWKSFAGSWFRGSAVAGAEEFRLLGFVLGLMLLFIAWVHVLALQWVRREKLDGYWIALSLGIYLAVSSALTYAAFRRFDFLLVDGLRGVLLAGIGWAAMRAPQTVRTLRLPDRAPGQRERREERPHRRSEGGRGPRDGRHGSRRRSGEVRSGGEAQRSLAVKVTGSPAGGRSEAAEGVGGDPNPRGGRGGRPRTGRGGPRAERVDGATPHDSREGVQANGDDARDSRPRRRRGGRRGQGGDPRGERRDPRPTDAPES